MSYYNNTQPISSSNGSATFTGIPKGELSYIIDVDCDVQTEKTYKGEIRNVVFDCNQTNTVDVNLNIDKDYSNSGDCCDMGLAIQFFYWVEYQGYNPLYNQNFTITGPNGFTYSGNTADSNYGGYMMQFGDLCNGNYTVTWEKDDGTKEVKEVRLRCLDKVNYVIFYRE